VIYVIRYILKLTHPQYGLLYREAFSNWMKTLKGLPLKAASLAYWSDALNRFVVEPDQIEVRIGASSNDIRLRQIVSVLP